MIDWVPRSVNVLEFVWFLTGVVPLAFGLHFLRRLRRVQLAIRAEGKPEADAITIATHIGSNWILAFGFAVIAGLGVVFMLIPPRDPGDGFWTVTPGGLVLSGGFFLLSGTLWLKSVWNQLRWGVITRYVAAHADEIRTLRGLGETVTQQAAALARVEAALAENTAISAHAADRAEAVYHVSNSMNEKIAAAITLGNEQTEALSQGNRQADERADAAKDGE
jgi:hypothetical protein